MHKIERGELTDLDWIPFAIGALALVTLRVAVIGDVRSLMDLAALTFYFSIFSAGRFAFKFYTYGHNLDPHAPIHMDPFTPAILGTKQIANFTTSSFPREDTYLIAVFASTVMLLTLWNLRSVVRPASRAVAVVPAT